MTVNVAVELVFLLHKLIHIYVLLYVLSDATDWSRSSPSAVNVVFDGLDKGGVDELVKKTLTFHPSLRCNMRFE